MFNHSITTTYNDDSGVVQTVLNKFTGTTEVGYDGTINAGTTDFEIDIGWKISTNQSLMMWSDQALTVKTNSSTTPGQTISLAANVMLEWGVGLGEINPITVDVTKLFVTNAGTTNAKLKMRALVT